MALIAAMVVASAVSPVSRTNAFHMTGRVAVAFGVFLLTSNGVTTPTRLRSVLTLAVAVGVVVSVLAILEYRGVRVVLSALRAFRPAVSTVGAQVRAGGPLQYPTIASMYLEVVFACGLGVMLAELDSARPARVALLFIALVLIADAITLTFTRAGLITMTTSLLLVGVIDRLRRHANRRTALLAGLAAAIALLFAGSRSAESLWLRFTTEGQESWYRARIVAPPRLELATGSMSAIPITLTNTGRLPWDSQAMPPLLPSYHWLGADGDRFVTFEGERTPFREPVLPDSTVNVAVNVRAPRQPGRYRLEWDLVQEGRLWFSTEPGASRTMSHVTVTGDPYTGPLITTRRRARPSDPGGWCCGAPQRGCLPLIRWPASVPTISACPTARTPDFPAPTSGHTATTCISRCSPAAACSSRPRLRGCCGARRRLPSISPAARGPHAARWRRVCRRRRSRSLFMRRSIRF